MQKPGERRSATIQDIAKAAGASVATVSRVLSNADYPVSPKMREKVLQVAKELHYTPNLLGRMLKSNSNTAIGVMVPTLQNPFFNQVILGIESEARRRDYEVVIYSSHRDPVLERRNIISMLQKRILGLILFSTDESAGTLESYISGGGCVALMESNFALENVIRAETDFYGAGREAAEYLISMGHRRVAFLTSPLTKLSRRKILNGVCEAFRRRGLTFAEGDVFVAQSEAELEGGMYEFELGKRLAQDFLERQEAYTAIVAVNDITAYGIMQELTRKGVHIPDDVSIISFDNILFSAMLSPPLTTVDLPSISMGSTACRLLIESMEDTSTASLNNNITFSYPCKIQIRQSVRRVE